MRRKTDVAILALIAASAAMSAWNARQLAGIAAVADRVGYYFARGDAGRQCEQLGYQRSDASIREAMEVK